MKLDEPGTIRLFNILTIPQFNLFVTIMYCYLYNILYIYVCIKIMFDILLDTIHMYYSILYCIYTNGEKHITLFIRNTM